MSHSKKKVLFLMSGSIAAFKACQVISRLVQNGNEVQVAATPSTFEFIGKMTLEGLTGKKVLSDLWESGRAMDHIHLTRWADCAVLCPATANTLARLAHGFADELVSAITLAWPLTKPYWIFPAMNHQMLQAEATTLNLKTLESRGFKVAPTQSGSLACGEDGPGRMLEAEEILGLIQTKTPDLGHVLITSGATREPVDGIRFISNVSTGQTASTICDDLEAQGWKVTYLYGIGAAQPKNALARLGFTSFADLDEKLRTELGTRPFAAVIHCAAVSDYSVANAQPKLKLASDLERTVKLTPNYKILPRLKEYSRNKQIKVVGFKLTLNLAPEQTLIQARQILSIDVDAVVANEWSSIETNRDYHPGSLLTKADEPQEFQDLHSLSLKLHQFIHQGGRHGTLS